MKIKVIGIGGIGTCLLPVLIRFLNFNVSDAFVLLIDGDWFEDKNRERQMFDCLGNKAEVTAERLQGQNPRVDLEAWAEYVTDNNVVELIHEGDMVLLCVDNHATRKLVSDRCEELNDVTLISGGNELTDGSVHVYVRKGGKDVTLPLANDFHPEIQYPEDHNPAEAGCDEQTESEPQLLLTNNLVAAMMLSSFYTVLQDKLAYDMVYCDLLSGNCRTVCRTAAMC